MTPISELIDLSKRLGEPARRLAILAEGNTSLRISDRTFWVKASGKSLENCSESSFVEVEFAPLLDAVGTEMDDQAIRSLLENSRVDSGAPLPSVETFMHAWLLTLDNVQVVAHTHPESLMPLLYDQDVAIWAGQRFFPDEVVCCGPAACSVPYVDPGLPLAAAIRDAVQRFVDKWGIAPKTIWLANHGLIALGKNVAEAWSATTMQDKAARMLVAARSCQKDPKPLTVTQVRRIYERSDEHHRQRMLFGE